MATLTRPRALTHDTPSGAVPTPFPTAERQRMLEEQLSDGTEGEAVARPANSSETANHEVLPSIAFVQKSCLMTLNNLLSAPTKWHPIVPDRRHSMPSSAQSSSALPDANAASALQTLVSNLRTRDSDSNTPIAESANDTALIRELEERVQNLDLDPTDAHLARTLVSLLSHFDRLSVIAPAAGPSLHPLPEQSSPVDVFDTLKRQLSDLQIERLSRPDAVHAGSPPALTVETALLWTQIDEELESVVALCKERTEGLPPRFTAADHLPPQYDPEDYKLDVPPDYDAETASIAPFDDKLGEKMRLDLEAVTMAIDRLYLVAPQLHNQRVELKSAKLEQMEKARRAGSSKGKERERDARELENMFEMLGKASERKITSQSVVLEGGMEKRLEKARQRDIQKRDAFVGQLVEHSDAGRFHGQDAVHRPRTKDDPETMLSLPEFIRESMSDPASVQRADPEAMVSLPDFMKEPVPEAPMLSRLKSESELDKKRRSRSMSAPSMSWLRPSSSRSSMSSGESKFRKSPRTSRPNSSRGLEPIPSVGLDVHYVAENHDNLRHILVFMTVSGATPGVDLEAEVLPSSSGGADGERLIVKSGPNTSSPLALPGHVHPGKKEVKVQGSHYEVKLTTIAPSAGQAPAENESAPLLDASQLSASNPTSFICASCSLPLIHSSQIGSYRDLPSEHWEELVDAWMCHSDQKLHEQVARNGRGFWPEAGQALVGGSYILFEESSVVKNNLCPAEQAKRGEDWRLVRCICGAVTGRCQEHQIAGSTPVNVYRLAKYSIRPVSPTAEPSRVPLSAFIVEDMSEFVHAHATYRFVVLDEEDERPRMLIWLFKPRIKLAYVARTQYALPRTGPIQAAKVLFKLLGPSTASSDLHSILNKYPGFPQAEYLFYPMEVCRRLAGMLKESNAAYPEGMRMMTGLDVGWLHRA